MRTAFIYSGDFLKYRFNEEHPFDPLRLHLTYDLLMQSGLLRDEELVSPRSASTAELEAVHAQGYIDAVIRASRGENHEDFAQYDLGTEDIPIFKDMHPAAALAVGGTLTAAELVMEGRARHAVNIAGGLHHAQKSKASGFCIYNDAAVAIAYLRDKYDARVLYLDIDAHHGDGVQNIFYDDPNVLVISIHESGHYLFPGTGDIYEQGSDEGYGYTINLPMEPYTQDGSFVSLFEAVVVPHVHAFSPDIIISQNGCDGHHLDPLTHLSLTTKGYLQIFHLIHDLAEQLCEGKLVALGGGGYNTWQVVPRVWALLWGQLVGEKLDGPLPEGWIKKWQDISGSVLPRFYCDDPDLVPQIPRRKEIEEKNQIVANRIMRQSVLLL